jgi:peptidoglycan/LPS O-acetylase OafA/YrhL
VSPVKSPTTARGDIQGLRAIAVLAVVADHAFAWPSGGFVGVDVFFVISGFLITGLLLRERERSGTISFTGFYRRRIRRIMPAAVLVLIATVIGTNYILGASRLSSVVWDAITAFFFSANWRFAITGTDYFQASGPVSPLQHFWSLSVEEQFYFVWPWVMLLALSLAGRKVKGLTPRARWAAGAAIGIIGVASFAWALYETNSSSTVAYFSTFSRAWELALGATLAIMTPVLERIPHRLRPLLAWLGLIGIVVSLFVTSSTSGFPAPGAAFPVLATGLVIVAGTGGRQRLLFPLTNPLSRYLGDISYSLYLWHYPVIIVFGPYLLYLLGGGSAGWLYYVILLATAVVLSIASYHLVETPIRKSRWLEPRTSRGRRRTRQGGSRTPYVVLGSVAGLTVVAVVVALTFNTLFTPSVSASADNSVAADSTSSASIPSAAATPAPAADSSNAQAQLTAQIKAALAAKSWPATLTPTVADAADETLPGHTAQCGSVKFLPASECTFGNPDAPNTALLVGDSIAQAYVPALAQIFGQGDWSLRITSMYACPFVDTDIGNATGSIQACQQRKQDEYATIAAMKPDLLIISNTYERGTDPATGLATTLGVWSTAFKSMIKKVAPEAKKFVVLPPPPLDKNIQTCDTSFSKPSDCVSDVANSQWITMASDQKATATAKKNGYFIDNRAWYCNTAGLCPPFVGTTLMKKDAAHPTADYVLMLTPVMTQAFAKAGLSQTASSPAAATSTPTPSSTG